MAPPKTKPDIVVAFQHKIMVKEFSDFFHSMLAEEPGWVGVTDQQFIDALADSLVVMGKRSTRGFAVLQTLVYELQDRLNKKG